MATDGGPAGPEAPQRRGFDAADPSTTVEELLRARLSELLGGWRGAVEAALPTLAFVGVWMARADLHAAVVASGIAVVTLVVLRLIQRQTLRYALSSVVATAIAAAFALRSGKAEDAFLPTILWNLGMGVGYLVSVLARWPVLGFLVAAADPAVAEDPSAFVRWRRHPGMVAVCSRLTLVLAALMLVRVAIMLPLVFAGQVAALGFFKIVLGMPAYLAVVAIMAGMLMRGRTPLGEERPREDPSPR